MNIKNEYAFSELKKKYGWNYQPKQDKMVNFALSKGVVIKPIQNSYAKMITFEIVDDTIANYQWVVCPIAPMYEVCKEGLIRNKDNKNLWTSIHNGYIYVTDKNTKQHILGHRMIIETFNPISNSQDYVVDHINGIKTDNRIENLRWVSAKGNQLYKMENWDQIKIPIQELLQLVGYEKMVEILQQQIAFYKKNKKF